MKDFIQFIIAASGILAIVLIAREERLRKWGYLFGLIGQPFWVWSNWQTRQWGVMVLSIVYLFCWGEGVWHFWVKSWLSKDKIMSDKTGAIGLTIMIIGGFIWMAAFIAHDSIEPEIKPVQYQQYQQEADPNGSIQSLRANTEGNEAPSF